jgi:hypothetical protein
MRDASTAAGRAGDGARERSAGSERFWPQCIRLDASDRDQGKLHFGYSEDMAEWRRETPLTYRLLDASRGVTVEKLERFLYRVTHAGRSGFGSARRELHRTRRIAD